MPALTNVGRGRGRVIAGGALLPEQRRDALLRLVRAAGGVRISEVSDELGVSDITVRRDIGVLVRHGLLERVHGGATGCSSARETIAAARTTIGRAAAQFVEPGMSVALTAGDAAVAAAVSLGGIPELTVVTNSTRAFGVLDELPGHRTVVLVGGQRTPWDAVVGPLAEQSIATMHFDVVLLAAFGVAPVGITTPDLAEAQTNRRFVERSQRTIIFAEATKWGRRSLSLVVPLDAIDVFVTDESVASHEWAATAPISAKILCCTENVRSSSPD